MSVNRSRNQQRLHRKKRIRVKGTASRPRFSVFRSLRGLSVQIIDDEKGNTLVAVTWKEIGANSKNDIKSAEKVGELVADKCLKQGIREVVFDRSGYKYHGKVKAVAEGARKKGLKF